MDGGFHSQGVTHCSRMIHKGKMPLKYVKIHSNGSFGGTPILGKPQMDLAFYPPSDPSSPRTCKSGHSSHEIAPSWGHVFFQPEWWLQLRHQGAFSKVDRYRHRKISCLSFSCFKGYPSVYIPTCFPLPVDKPLAKSPTKSTNKKSLVKKKHQIPSWREKNKGPLGTTHLSPLFPAKAVADLVQFAQDGDQDHQQDCSYDQLPEAMDLHGSSETWRLHQQKFMVIFDQQKVWGTQQKPGIYMEVSRNGGTPIAGGSISWKIPFKWMMTRGSPLSGNLHMSEACHTLMKSAGQTLSSESGH